ncbi:MAG TPA: hypothetical protein VNO52_04165 [Methylomirabilota bacterium]|nr:hypothetical protein [Methylomirabilota bacterium]
MNWTTFWAIGLTIGCLGCGRHGDPGGGHAHTHVPPHGGVGVELGNHEFNLELVLDRAGGQIEAYVLDAHMEEFVRIPAESIPIRLKAGGEERPLALLPVAAAATGEKVGDTSHFRAQTDWLRSTNAWDGVLIDLTVRGKRYTNVAFRIQTPAPAQ